MGAGLTGGFGGGVKAGRGSGNQCNLSRTSDSLCTVIMYVCICMYDNYMHTTFAVDWVTATNKAEREREPQQ